MVVASKHRACACNLDDKVINIRCEDKHLKQVSQFKLLGTKIDANLGLDSHINKIIRECFATIAILNELKRLSPFRVTK